MMNWVGRYQLVGFHPHHQFDATDLEDAANYTNRSPLPNGTYLEGIKRHAGRGCRRRYCAHSQAQYRHFKSAGCRGAGKAMARLLH